MSVLGLFGVFGGAKVDDAEGDADARNLQAQVRSCDMSGAAQFFPALRDGMWDEREFYCSLVAPACNDQVLDAWCESEPGNALTFLLRGKRAIAAAWEARGSGTSGTVTDEGQMLFQQRLAAAEQNLARAAELDPADPTPHGYMIDCARGLGRGWQFGDHCFRQAVARDPAHRHAHQAMLTILTEKWGGSHGAMFRFANGASQHHPAGSELHVLVILAHLERWLYYSFEDDRPGAIRYAQTPSVQQEVVEAYDRSLGSPAHRPRRSTVRARSIAAFWFYLAGDVPRLQRELTALGGVCTEFPWCWGESDAAKTYGRAKKLAG